MKLTNMILGAALLSSILFSCNGKEEAGSDSVSHNVFVFTPEVGTTDGIHTYPGRIEEARNISVGFKTAGQIKRIFVKEGDRVSAGQLLAILDTVDYALGVRTLRVQAAQLRAEHERHKQLFAAGNMSPNDFEKAQAGLRQLELQLQMNENKLKYCRLYAPSSGVITSKNFESSEMVDAGTPVFELMDNNHLEAVVDLPVGAYMRRGTFRGFTATSPHLPGKTFPLQMLSLTPKADNNQLYRLRLSLPASSQLTAGQNIYVEILTDEERGKEMGNNLQVHTTSTIPAGAVIERKGQTGVWAVNLKDSTVKFTPVTISGTGENGNVDVTSGLTPGMVIVRAGVHHLTEGEKVKILQEGSSTNPGNIL